MTERRQRDQPLVDLVRRRGEALTRYAYLYTGDVHHAQDLVQDAMVKVFGRTRSGATPEALEGYVRRAITTTYIDGYRRRRQWGAVQHLVTSDETRRGPDEHVPAQVDVVAALTTLAPQERAAVVLRYLDDLTVAAVADRMGLAQGSVKRYLSNAVRKLERVLGELDPPEDSAPVRTTSLPDVRT